MKHLYYCTIIPLTAVSVSNRLQLLHCPDNPTVAAATEECSTGHFWPSVLSPVSPKPYAFWPSVLSPISPIPYVFWPSVLSPVSPTPDTVLTLCFEPSFPYIRCCFNPLFWAQSPLHHMFLTLCWEPSPPTPDAVLTLSFERSFTYTVIFCCFNPLFWDQSPPYHKPS